MCFAVPSRIVSFDGRGRATVEAFGMRREVDVSLLDEPATAGDYVLVRAGGFAVERVDEERALDALALYAEIEARMAESAVP
jgi:hydrogenase expression/formation protein HypC